MPQLLHYLHVDSKTRVRLPLAQLAVRDPTAAAATGLSAGQEGAMLPPAVPGEGMSSSAVSPWQNKTDEVWSLSLVCIFAFINTRNTLIFPHA